MNLKKIILIIIVAGLILVGVYFSIFYFNMSEKNIDQQKTTNPEQNQLNYDPEIIDNDNDNNFLDENNILNNQDTNKKITEELQQFEDPLCGDFILNSGDNIFEEDLCLVGDYTRPEVIDKYWTWECAEGNMMRVCNYYCPEWQIAGGNSCLDITLRINDYYIDPYFVKSDQTCTIRWEIYLSEPANTDNTNCVLKTLKNKQININSFEEGKNSISFGVTPNDHYSLFCSYQVSETGEYGQIQTDFYECKER
jgi:hypothetical protein